MVKWAKELEAKGLEEIEPITFYEEIFEAVPLQEKGVYNNGEYCGIAVEVTDETVEKTDANGDKKKIRKINRYSITRELDTIRELLKSENFVLLSPISYVGKTRRTENTRLMYAFAVEIDNLREEKPIGIGSLFAQMQNGILPEANYIVCSGNGIHLYFLLDVPIRLFTNVRESLSRYKRYITRRFWNSFITMDCEEEQIQFESAFQGFRLVGGVTKNGDRTRVFRYSNTPATIEYLNEFVNEYDVERRAKYDREKFISSKIDICYHDYENKDRLTLDKAKELYPDWYEHRIVNKEQKGTWTPKRDLYDWWKRKIGEGAKVGHRYYTLMCLSVYAIKCNIDYEELEADAYSYLEQFDDLRDNENERFTKNDIEDALQIFRDKNYITFPRNSISKLAGIEVRPNKRNYRNQYEHLARIRTLQDFDYPNGEWRNKEGRPVGSGTKQQQVLEWRKNNPAGKKIECERETGLSRHTVLKWWNSETDATD